MQSPTIAPLRALAIATALVAGTGVAAAALVSPGDIEAQTVRFETASDATDQTRSAPEEHRTSAPAPALGTAGAGGETAAPGPVEDTAVATGAAPRSGVDDYTIAAVGESTGRFPLPLSTSALGQDPPAVVADVLALLPDPAVLTAAVTQCIDELRTLVPDVRSGIDREAGLRGIVEGLFDGMADGALLAPPDPAAIAASIEVCMTSLQGVLPAPEALEPLFDSLAAQAALSPELAALVDQMRQLFDQMKQSGPLAAIDPHAALDALRSLIPADFGSADSPVIGMLEAFLDGLAPAA
jgi:hypothetical protein